MDISLDFIQQIENESNDPNAFNKKSQARGIYQITPICLEEWNNFNKSEKYKEDDLFKPEVNKKIADWYLHKRIPQMLTSFKKPITLENVLTSYNAGINYVVKNKPLPTETTDYIKKYKKLSDNEGASIVKKALAIARGKK